MKFSRIATLLLLLSATVAAVAQPADDADAIRREHWNFAVLASGGTGLTDRTNVQFVRAGVRAGRVMTGVLGTGVARGTFELNSEFMPVDVVLWGGYRSVYGLAMNPLVMKWNFTAGGRTVPYFLAQGGVLWTTVNVPPGNTSYINFTSGAGIGFQHFLRPRRSINFDVRAIHLSNASLGTHNPGVNASLQFSAGYNWWKQ